MATPDQMKTATDLESNEGIERIHTGIEGVDALTRGGLPLGRSTLVTGTAGAGKTMFGTQFLVEGARRFGQGGVMVCFEESPEELRRNVRGMGWDLAALEEQGLLAFVDASPRAEDTEIMVAGQYNLKALLARIEHAIKKVQAKRVVLDTLSAFFIRFPDENLVRGELFRISTRLKELDVSTILTAERVEDYGAISTHGVEEFVSDCVVILRNGLDVTRRRRTIEVLKLRGGAHAKGEFPISIGRGGITVVALATLRLQQPSTHTRISSGSAELDQMCGGGFYRDSVILVSGATGTGKTLTATHFVHAVAQSDERGVIFGYEESSDQLLRNAAGWGMPLEELIERDRLRVFCQFPESGSLEDHLVSVRNVIEEFKPQRIVIDSISALRRIAGNQGFLEFTISLTALLKQNQIAALYTSTTDQLIGVNAVTEQNISTLTDSIILLRYVEHESSLNRGVSVLKMRGSEHDKRVCRFTIDNAGMQIGEPFPASVRLFPGSSTYIGTAEPHD